MLRRDRPLICETTSVQNSRGVNDLQQTTKDAYAGRIGATR
jgi:hypothetical protein